MLRERPQALKMSQLNFGVHYNPGSSCQDMLCRHHVNMPEPAYTLTCIPPDNSLSLQAKEAYP